MPPKYTLLRERTIQVLEYMKKEAPCTTISAIARKFAMPWESARKLLEHLSDSKLLLEISINKRVIWCLSEQAAAVEIATLKRETWRLMCNSGRRFITPSVILKAIANDPQARIIFDKYISVGRISGNALQFIASILEDILGPPLEKGKRKVRFYVPRKICEKEPKIISVSVRRYKQPHKLVTFKVPDTMYSDIIAATSYMGITIPQLVRVAIARLLSQYRHVLDS